MIRIGGILWINGRNLILWWCRLLNEIKISRRRTLNEYLGWWSALWSKVCSQVQIRPCTIEQGRWWPDPTWLISEGDDDSEVFSGEDRKDRRLFIFFHHRLHSTNNILFPPDLVYDWKSDQERTMHRSPFNQLIKSSFDSRCFLTRHT